MNQSKRFLVYLLGSLVLFGILISGCTKTEPAVPGEVSACSTAKTTQEIADEAKVADFSCFYKKWEGANTLHFKVGVTNASSVPQRFRVNVFLENGKAVNMKGSGLRSCVQIKPDYSEYKNASLTPS